MGLLECDNDGDGAGFSFLSEEEMSHRRRKRIQRARLGGYVTRELASRVRSLVTPNSSTVRNSSPYRLAQPSLTTDYPTHRGRHSRVEAVRNELALSHVR